MAIGKINGPMLQPNLERQGVNIALDGDLTYWDVSNRYVGVRTTTPNYSLDVNGNVHLGNLYVLGNTITAESGFKLNLGSISNIVISGGAVDSILYTDGAGNLSFANISTLITLEGFYGNGITLGSNAQGSFSNAVTLTSATTVTDAIALINQNLGNVTANVKTLTSEVYANANVAAYLPVYSGNITANIITANAFVGNITGNVTGNVTGNITATIASFGNITGTVLTVYQPYITSVGTLTNLTVSGNTTVGNVVTSTNFYGNIFADTISPQNTTVVAFTNQTAIKLPTGDETSRPTGVAGYFRYNTHLATVEYYNGAAWVPFSNQIVSQTITPDGLLSSFPLNQTSTADGLMVSINGTVQRPGSAYTTSLDGLTINFTEAPLATDIIDIRFIASAGSTTLDYSIVDTGNVSVGTSNVIVDSFPSTLYRSAKYTISSSNDTDATIAEVMLVQMNGTTALGIVSNVNTGSNTLTFYANVSGSTVNLLVKGSNSSNKLKLQRTYFDI